MNDKGTSQMNSAQNLSEKSFLLIYYAAQQVNKNNFRLGYYHYNSIFVLL